MKNYAFFGSLLSGLVLALCACTAKSEELVSQNQTPPTSSYPYPAITPTQKTNPYPQSQDTQAPRLVQVTLLPSATPFPTPIPASEETLAIAKSVFEEFFKQLPFASEMGSTYEEYYGCQDSLNMGAALYFTLSGTD